LIELLMKTQGEVLHSLN